jgi:hypothetical protein
VKVVLIEGIAFAIALSLIWVVQSVALKLADEPLAWPLRYTTKKPAVRWTGRAMVQISWLIILFGIFAASGIRPLDALHQLFPLPPPSRSMALVCGLFIGLSGILFAVYIEMGWVRITPRFDPATRRAKTLRRFLTPLPLATVEESVFRGAVLGQLLKSLPDAPGYVALGIVYSSVLFAAVHFIKRPGPQNPLLQHAYGFFAAGCLFGVAFVVGGRSLWLPIVLHATGILTVELNRLYMTFEGPRWLVGFSESPQSGLIGSLVLLCIAGALPLLI